MTVDGKPIALKFKNFHDATSFFVVRLIITIAC